jgi:hypothetical protein
MLYIAALINQLVSLLLKAALSNFKEKKDILT